MRPLLLLSLTACTPMYYDSGETGTQDTDTADADTDADTDSDTDADSDADTDADADADPAIDYASLSGSVTFTKTLDGQPGCDLDVGLTSVSNYIGSCPECDFAFRVDGVITRDDSVDCRMTDDEHKLAFLENDAVRNFWLGFGASYDVNYYSYSYTYNDVMLGGADVTYSYTSYYYDYTYTYTEPQVWAVAFDGAPYGRATFDGTDLAWTYTYDDSQWVQPYGTSCSYGSDWGTEGTAAVTDAQSGTASLPCDTDVQDIWEVEVEGGSTLDVSIDMLDAATAFDASMWLTSPSSCIEATVEDGFRCTADPVIYHSYWAPAPCPAWSLDVGASDGGTWQIGVDMVEYAQPDATCPANASLGTYTIAVDGGVPDTLALAHQGVNNDGRYVDTRVEVTGLVTVVPAN